MLHFSDTKISYVMDGIGTSGVLTGTMTFKTYSEEISGNAFPWGSSVELVCENDVTIDIPKFYVTSRNVNGFITSWSCSDKMGQIDEPIAFLESHFTDDKIDAYKLLDLCVSTCGFDSYSFAGNSMDIFNTIGDIAKSLVEGKTVREILDMFSAAMCGHWLDDHNKLVFSPFGNEYHGNGLYKHTPISEGGTKTCTKVVMYNGDKIYTSGSGAARETIMISTPLASQELCSAVLKSVNGYTYKSWACEKGLADYFILPGNVIFTDDIVRFCTNVAMYPSAAGIFYSASANNIFENEYSYTNQVQRQLKRKLELDVRNGNMALTKEGIKIFANKNETDNPEDSATTIISVFSDSEV